MPVPKGVRIGGRQKGTPNKRSQEREKLIKEAASVIEDALPISFKGDAHAFLMKVYKDETMPVRDRMTAAAAALPYEKPKLASIEHKGNEANPLAFAVVSSVPRESEKLNGHQNGHAHN